MNNLIMGSLPVPALDARANEHVMSQLKKALEDQDATIELQEKALSQKEEEIAAAQKGRGTRVKLLKRSREYITGKGYVNK